MKRVYFLLLGLHFSLAWILTSCRNSKDSTTTTDSVNNVPQSNSIPTATLTITPASQNFISSEDLMIMPPKTPEQADKKFEKVIFAIDESTSIHSTSSFCGGKYLRHKIPEIYLLILAQYYYQNPSYYTPAPSDLLIDITYWPGPRNVSRNLKATELSDLFRQSHRLIDRNLRPEFGIFFAKAINDSNEHLVVNGKTALIFLTDGNFYSDVVEKEKRGADQRKTEQALRNKSNNLEVYVVLLCSPDEINNYDYGFWVKMHQDKLINGLYIYEEQKTPLIINVWSGVLANTFPYRWDGRWQGIYFLEKDRYFDLQNVESEQQYKPCRYLGNEAARCVPFSFPSSSTGFAGGVIPDEERFNNSPSAIIWGDQGEQMMPDSRLFVWDSRVRPFLQAQKCSAHNWYFDFKDRDTVVFWWRALAYDSKNLFVKKEENSNNIVYLLKSEHIESAHGDFKLSISLKNEDLYKCFEAFVFNKRNGTGMPVSAFGGSWKIDIPGLESIIFDQSNSYKREFLELFLDVYLKYLGNDGVKGEDLHHPVNLQLRYIPYLYSYQWCNSSSPGTDQCKFVDLLFSYIEEKYFLSSEKEKYRPYLRLIGGSCNEKSRIPVDENYQQRRIKISRSQDNSLPPYLTKYRVEFYVECSFRRIKIEFDWSKDMENAMEVLGNSETDLRKIYIEAPLYFNTSLEK